MIILLLILIMRYRGWRLGFIAAPQPFSARQPRLSASQTKADLIGSVPLLRDAIANISDGFVLYDADNRFVTCNEKFLEIYPWCRDICVPGLPFLEMAHKGLEVGMYPQALDDAQEWIDRRLREHSDFVNTFQRQLVDGRWIMVRNRQT